MFGFLDKKKNPENIKDVLSELKDLKKQVKTLFVELEGFKESCNLHIQRLGVVRFNPFRGKGGNQSFSIAFLDGQNDGVVMTSLYSQEGNRVYAKSVKNGTSEHSLSDEEKKAISEAVGA